MDDNAQVARHRRPTRWPLRRGQTLNRVVAGLSWLGALLAMAMGVRGWMIGGLTLETLISLAFVLIGCAFGGALALSGDGDVTLFTGMDEGQRSAMIEAMAPAFGAALAGLIALWIAYDLQPAWRADAYLQEGVLLLIVLSVYLGGYLWRRRHV